MVTGVEQDVLQEIERAAGRPVQRSDSLTADLGLDSLTLTSLAVALEDRFQLRLSPADGEELKTVADVIHLIARRHQQKEEP